MSVLGLALAGPMMSFSVATHERERQTELLPTRAAVLGLLACCLGHPREELGPLVTLRLGLRLDAPGVHLSDFHVVMAPMRAAGTPGPRSFPTRREYLAGAAFAVGLEGERALLETVRAAAARPAFVPYLGRKSCLPGRPLLFAGGHGQVQEESLTALLAGLPPLAGEGEAATYLEDPAGTLAIPGGAPLGGGRYGEWRLRPGEVVSLGTASA